MVEIVNVVGSGFLDKEFDLSAVSDELGSIADFDPKKYPGMYVRFSKEAPLITVYRTGKFIITGAGSIKLSHFELINPPENYFCENGMSALSEREQVDQTRL